MVALVKPFFIVIQIVVSLALFAVVMTQTTKSEGLTGTIGGKSESNFRGKPGTEEKLQEITKWTAIAFLISSAIVGYIS